MSARTSSIPPKINSGTLTGLPWLQKGYKYGSNDSGPFQVWIEEGLDADIDADAINFDNALWTYTVERLGGGISRLTANAGWTGGSTYTGEVLENIWELDAQETEKSLLDSDFQFGSFTSISKNTREALAVLIDGNSAKWVDSSDIYGGYGVAYNQANDKAYVFDDGINIADYIINLPSADYAPAHSLYLLMKARVTSYPIMAPIIRHTQLLSNQYTVKASYSNVGRIISSAGMTSIEDMPSTLLFDALITPTPQQYIETPGDLQYGWKKSMPSVSRLAKYKWRVVNNYQFGLWPVKLFGNVL